MLSICTFYPDCWPANQTAIDVSFYLPFIRNSRVWLRSFIMLSLFRFNSCNFLVQDLSVGQISVHNKRFPIIINCLLLVIAVS